MKRQISRYGVNRDCYWPPHLNISDNFVEQEGQVTEIQKVFPQDEVNHIKETTHRKDERILKVWTSIVVMSEKKALTNEKAVDTHYMKFNEGGKSLIEHHFC